MLHRLLPRRLDMQLAMVCAITLTCTVPWFVFHEVHEELEHFLVTIKQQTKVLASNIAVTSVEHIVTSDFTSLDKLILRSALFPGIVDIQVINHEGQILSDVIVKDGNPETRFSNQPILEFPADSQPVTVVSADNMVIWSPIGSGVDLGWIRMDYSLDEAKLHEQERMRDYMGDAIIITLALVLLLVFAMRRPLKMISVAADFSSRLDEKSGEQIPIQNQSTEIDKLFLALNRASASLTNQDNTIKKVLKDLETQKHALDEHSIVSISDVDGNITYANDKLLSSTGYKLEELLGKNHRIFNSGTHSKAFFKDLWDTITQGNIWHGIVVDHDKQSHKVWMQTTIVPFLDSNGKPYEYVAIRSDITAQKKYEALLAEKNKSLEELTDQLEDKVKTRTTELQQANEKLLQLNNIKSEFVSIVSHELRTPLTSIKSFAEILEDDFDELDPETRSHYLSIINEESVRLGNLINDVLDLQKIDAGKMTWHKEKTDLKKLASTTIELFSKSYKHKGLELRIEIAEDELVANIDSDKIKQALSNLLSNAYKFTDQGSVTLKLRKRSSDDKNNQEVEISVIDTGAGIPENELGKVFERFHQVDNSETREKGGSGLGLAICKDIIEHHGGQLSVTSMPGEGSHFTFNLPLLDTSKKRIGEILVESGAITQEAIDRALAKQN